jgi:hypothetical protein
MDLLLLVSPRSNAEENSKLTLKALALAMGHFLLFQWLDGALAEHRRLHQSQVTALSLLITTAFKACAITAVGLSFAQHLWHIVRRKALKVMRVEQLFSIRSNPLDLVKFGVVRDAPLLFLMALTVWLIPLAAVYPPSALTIVSRPYSNTSDILTSVMNPALAPDFDCLFPKKHSTLFLMEGFQKTCNFTNGVPESRDCKIYYSYKYGPHLRRQCDTQRALIRRKVPYTISTQSGHGCLAVR